MHHRLHDVNEEALGLLYDDPSTGLKGVVSECLLITHNKVVHSKLTIPLHYVEYQILQIFILADMSNPDPFIINIPDDELERLKVKLSVADFPDEPNGYSWDYGTPLADIKKLVAYWHNEYDWRKAEAKLNEMPQFITKINVEGYGDLIVHFVHAKSKKPNAIPLCFVHGWPGSFIEVQKILPLLLEGEPAFDVVAPSLIDYGFSDVAPKTGFNIWHQAEMANKLMLQLGHPKYVTQGGDIGYAVTRWMGRLYPDHCRANHLNMAVPRQSLMRTPEKFEAALKETKLRARDKQNLERTRWFTSQGHGYFQEHSTKPQTLAMALSDSPVGLLAWIYEKLRDWTDNYPWTPDEILTWISIYWFSEAGPARRKGCTMR